jgi:5-methylcytosine-specific restriction endonuclease McrA
MRLEVRLISASLSGQAQGAFGQVWGAFNEAGEELARGAGVTERVALSRLVDANYDRVGEIVMKSQNYACADCGAVVGLERHHVKFRSHGRVDTEENIVGLCPPDHRRRHGGK